MGLPAASAYQAMNTPARNKMVIVTHTAQPCPWFLVMRPRYHVSPLPMLKMDRICKKLESGVGFSYGCAALALVLPPPLVPSILMATCDAIGPWEMSCSSTVWVTMTDRLVATALPSTMT